MSQDTESESKIAVEEEDAPEIIAVSFDDENAAQNAVRILNKALRSDHRTIYQGALLSRGKDNALTIRDLRDMGLGELITGTADLTLDTSRTGLKLTWAVVSTGVGVVVGVGRLAKNTFDRAMGLLGSFFSIPSRRRLERFDAGVQVQELGIQLPEGKNGRDHHC